MKRMRKAISLLLSAAFLFAVLAGCNSKDSKTAEKDTFVIGLDSDIVALDPAFAYDFTTNPVINQISQGLLTFDVNNQLQPMLASSWQQVDDLTYVYQIRSDVTFSDGSPMTMDDVVYSMERIRNPELASYLGWMYDNVDKIEKTGDWELTVTLKKPDATWQYVPATTACHVLKKDFVEAAGDTFGTAQTGIVGTGPYAYVSWTSGTEVVLEKNKNYWDKDHAGYFNKLIFKVITEDNTRVVALKTGDIDCTVAPPASQLAELVGDPNISLTSNSGFGVLFVAFNTQKAPFNNAEVRKAVSMAVDMDTIYKNLVKEKVGDAPTALPSSKALFSIEPERWNEYLAATPKHVFDVNQARTLLANAGYPDGFEFTLVVNEDTMRNSVALAMQSNLAEVGIKMNVSKVSTDEHTRYQFGEVLDANGLRDYDMIMAGWEADYPDPSGNLTPLYQGGNSSNSAAYNNEKVNALIAEQMAESNPTVRNDLMFDAFDIIIQDTPYLFVHYPIKNIAMNKNYTGVEMNASWIWNIHFQDVHPVEG